MIIAQILSKAAFTIWRLLAIATLLAGLVPSTQVMAQPEMPAAQAGDPEEYTVFLPLIFNSTAPVRDDLLAAESNLAVLSVSAGYAHACAVRPDSTLICWGLDSSGQATPLPGAYRAVSAGANHTCALRPDGTPICWGDNTYGQASPPAEVFEQISAGGYHTCAMRADGSLACWGWNAFTQLDNIPSGSFTQVSSGNLHTCALRADGSLACWGWDADGQVSAPAGTFSQVSAGGSHSCAVTADGALACWGSNLSGQANPPAESFRAVSAGSLHTCGLRADGTISCWGGNGFGQLNEIPEGVFNQISAGGQHTCAVREGGTMACWGWNRYGQSFPPSGYLASAGFAHACAVRADGTLICWGENEAGQIETPDGFFTRVSAGNQHSCAVDHNGALICWGSDAAGQSSAPSGSFFEVSAGGQHSCALGLDSALACWGRNSAGQASAPSGVFSQVSAGAEHSCAVRLDGSLACWGSNSAGQSSAPTGTYSQVSAGGQHSCALTTTGVLNCWGSNSAGQLTIPAGTFAQVSAGERHTCGVRADGSLQCWGDNQYGQSDAPAGLFSQVSAGGQHSCAVPQDGLVVCWGLQANMPVVDILPESLPEARLGTAYNQTFNASGGEAPYIFSISAGALPAGLALSADGQLTGTPSAEGTFYFTVRVQDSSVPVVVGQRAYTLVVVSAPTDDTPPVIKAQISGTKGSAGWYVGPVKVSWKVTDPESEITTQTGCDTVTVRDDTPGKTLTCSATSAGGSSTESVTIKIDQTPPGNVRAVPDRAPDTLSWYNHPLKIEFEGQDALSGIDTCTRVVYEGPDSVAAEVEGTCTDKAGNTSHPVTFTFPYDSTPPVLKPIVQPNPVYLNGEAVVKANASDALSGLVIFECEPLDTSSVGDKQVNCRALDEAGNEARAEVSYSVVYRFLGFEPPVKNPPFVNWVTAGQTVPIKFRLADDKGKPVGELVDFEVRIKQFKCLKSDSINELDEQYAESPSLSLGSGHYHYNWKTSRDLAHSCVRLTVDLGEGSAAEHEAYFFFKK